MGGMGRVGLLEVESEQFPGSVENLDLGGLVNCPPNELVGPVVKVLSHHELFEIARRF